MFFDIAWPEFLLIAAVALVVIGPKDLPRALRVAGMWVRKARTLSREFQSSVDQMIREAELEEMRQELKKATEFDVEKELKQAVDPTGELSESIKPPDLPDYFDEASGASLPPPAATNEPVAGESEAASEEAAQEPELPGLEPAPVELRPDGSPDREAASLPMPTETVPPKP